jgi:hypothetical protein
LDIYTEQTKNWLDERFCDTTDDGIFLAHQPIYGFKKGHCANYIISRYIITYQLMRALSHLRFDSLLDVGGAEGYKAAIARLLFDVEVKSSDLSESACKRAKEIFNVDGDAIDICKLPYDDNEFDVVVCSETLEHIPDMITATKELIRVSRKAVVITVPHESDEIIEQNIKEKIPHAHLHAINPSSFDFAKNILYEIKVKKILSPYLNVPCAIVESRKRERSETNYSKISVNIYNSLLPLFNSIFGKRTAGILLRLDEQLPRISAAYSGMVFLLLKEKNIYSNTPHKKITPASIINFEVPYHILEKV